MEECLAYFRKAVHEPLSVPPWSEWWAANVATVERIFPLVDYVRLKHRKLRGAREILRYNGELPDDFRPPSPLVTGSCTECGERIPNPGAAEVGSLTCPTCGAVHIEPKPE